MSSQDRGGVFILAALADNPDLMPNNPNSIVVHTADDRLLTESEAILYIAYYLGGGWRILAIFGRCIPRIVRNGIYRLIAKYRYRVFGRVDSCTILK